MLHEIFVVVFAVVVVVAAVLAGFVNRKIDFINTCMCYTYMYKYV